jgi:hypothetical protein
VRPNGDHRASERGSGTGTTALTDHAVSDDHGRRVLEETIEELRFSLDRARAQAWQTAVRLRPLDADARRRDVAELDRLVSVLAYLITRPVPPLAWLLPIAERLADHDTRVVTRRLLGHLA